MDGNNDLEGRLRDLGRAPVDRDIADAHLAAIAEVRRPRRPRFGWKAVAAAGMVGFLAGSTSLAAAGSLPAPAQDVAHDVLGAVGIDVPRSTEGCPEGTSFRNHGEYVESVEAAGGDVEAAAHSDCGKPAHAGRGGGGQGGQGGPPSGTPRPDADGDPCTGPPPWAGAHLTRAERDALREQRLQQCGSDDETGAVEPEDTGDADSTEEPATTPAPTEPPTTTTTVDATTTTTVDEVTTTTTG